MSQQPETKVCTRCKETKSLDDFRGKSSARDKRQHVCRPCHQEQKRAWRAANPDKVRAQNLRYWRKQLAAEGQGQ